MSLLFCLFIHYTFFKISSPASPEYPRYHTVFILPHDTTTTWFIHTTTYHTLHRHTHAHYHVPICTTTLTTKLTTHTHTTTYQCAPLHSQHTTTHTPHLPHTHHTTTHTSHSPHLSSNREHFSSRTFFLRRNQSMASLGNRTSINNDLGLEILRRWLEAVENALQTRWARLCEWLYRLQCKRYKPEPSWIMTAE